MPKVVLPAPWSQFLAEVDQGLSEAVELHCIGGFVLTAVYGIPRPTGDIDYISAIPRQSRDALEALAGRDSKLAKKHKVFLQSVGIVDLPENYEDRLQTLQLGLQKLSLRVADPYDLILSKLTRNSPKDMEDVKALVRQQHLKFDLMMERFTSEMGWVPNRRWHEQTLNVVWKDYFEI